VGVLVARHGKRSASAVRFAAAVSATEPAAHINSAVPVHLAHAAAATRGARVSVTKKGIEVRPDVALLVLLGHYEGLASGRHLQVYVPLSSAAAFAVKPAGVLLTVRHLTHLAKENNFPSTLQSLKLPTLTLRDISYVACFGPESTDWIDARLLYESEQHDIAVLSTNRRFPTALDCTGHDVMRGEVVHAWRYPGVLTFDNRYTDAARVEKMIRDLPQTQSVNLLAAVARECFGPVSVAENVVVPERNIDGTGCVELSTKPAEDNGGGPIVDSVGRVIAIAEPAGKQAGNAIGILVNQLQDEIAPYLSPVGGNARASSVRHNHPRIAYN
jgi:hypothetical protein